METLHQKSGADALSLAMGANNSSKNISEDLRKAAASGDVTTVAHILSDPVNLFCVVEQDAQSGFTALHWACHEGHLDIVRLLIESGSASVDVRSFYGETPLDIAVRLHKADIVAYLSSFVSHSY